jgi:hypothetical protein
MLISINIKKHFPADFKNQTKKLIIKSFNTVGLGKYAGKCANYSQFNEQSVIRAYVDKIRPIKYCVDIAAGNGLCQSNTYALYLNGWHGLAIEYDAQMFIDLTRTYKSLPGVTLSKSKVTPDTVVDLLQRNKVPINFGLLNLDIDGYDYFVLEKILTTYKPSLICTEINEKIPPPIKFTVKWSDEFVWRGGHVYGQSLAQLHELMSKSGYDLVKIVYNNAFYILHELNPEKALTPENAYRDGYVNKPDRKEKFPWNTDLEEVLHMTPNKALVVIKEHFKKDSDKFTISI